MKSKHFFSVFARLVEKVTNEPVNGDIDFDWRPYYDRDMPPSAQKWCARMAADDYLKENGYLHSLNPREVVISDLIDSLS